MSFLPADRSLGLGRGRRTTESVPEIVPVEELDMTGVVVRVIQPSIYQKPDTKAITAEAGDIITINTGVYAQECIAQGLVERFEDPSDDSEAKQVAEDQNNDSDDSGVSAEYETAWEFYSDSGAVRPNVAQRLWDSGFTGTERLLASYQQHGFDEIIQVKGVGKTTAVRLLSWAGELPEILADDLLSEIDPSEDETDGE